MLGIKPRAFCQANAAPPSYSWSLALGQSPLKCTYPALLLAFHITHHRSFAPGLADRRKGNYLFRYTSWNVSIRNSMFFLLKKSKH